jgi:hypothetical protein
LQKQHSIILWDGQQFPQRPFRVRRKLNKVLAAMADLHNRHARAMPVKEFGLRLFQNGRRQSRRAGAKVIHAIHC